MTPIFWKYLIKNHNGPAVRFVAEEDREWAEREVECDPHLLSYEAHPQIDCCIFRCPADEILEELWRTRLDLQRMEVDHLHDAVVTINNTHWPAYHKENGMLVDMRILDPEDRSPTPRLIFRPDALRRSGIPEAFIEAAAHSNPPGLILLQDVPQFKGCDDQPTSI